MDRRLSSTWWSLKIALGTATVLAGLDKFSNVLTNWADYLNPVALQGLPVSPEAVMRGIGVVEILIGLAILTRWTRLGAYLAACWLVATAVNLVSMGKFYEHAVRDLLLAVAAFALARLTAVRRSALADSDATPWRPAPREILTLKL